MELLFKQINTLGQLTHGNIRISSLKIRQEFFNQIRRMLWGKRFWTKSYFLISVRNGATTAIIKRYIKINGRIDIR
ncbi:transposase, partial [uncultured Parasutterella sp.]